MADSERPGTQAAKTARMRAAAERALAEAAARRAERAQAQDSSEPRPRELAGRKGPEPARFGDWEVKGIATDF